ncbi:MAG TPA: phosphoribosylglycinamide formyltransferase [Candidatus Limnocylindrales bacterium]|nr:phosphoribosylglycinamide formyltransferase [Candidatus Limnocylindrales bacterium]
MKRVAVFASGRGTNLQALIEATKKGEIPAKIVLVITDREDAQALRRAAQNFIKAFYLSPEGLTREEYDSLLLRFLQDNQIDLIALAGFMRILSPVLIRAYPNKILNIHPSLLPAFPGLHAQRQALEYGVKVTGCTVHLVDEEVDHGPIVIQRTVPVYDTDTEETLSARILEQEHIAYPEALKLLAEDRLIVQGRRVFIRDAGTT